MKTHKITALLFFILSPVNLAANDLEDALGGFDDFESVSTEENSNRNAPETINSSATEGESTWYTFSAYTSFLGAYNYAQDSESTVAPGDLPMDFSGLSRARTKVGLNLEMKHGENWRSKIETILWYDASWAINGRDGYTEEVLDTYESFIDLKDAYIQGSLTPYLDLKVGRQYVIWGKSDSIRITDIINPLDKRNPGMVDIEDLRLSEFMTRLDYYFGDWGLSGIIIHEPRLEIEAAFGSDYLPSDIFGVPIPYSKFPERQDPDANFANTQYAMSLDGHFSGWDLSYYAAHVYDNRFDVEITNNVPIRTVDKIYMAGIASNIVSGSWLFKSEAAFINDINYRSTDNKDRLDVLVGFEYMGFKNTVLSFELADRHIFDYEEHMLTMTLPEAIAQSTFPDFVREDSVQIAGRLSFNFNHDNAMLIYLISLSGGNGAENNFDGGFQRLWVDYKYTDNLSLNTGIVNYISGDSIIPFYTAIENNDRVFAEIKYDF